MGRHSGAAPVARGPGLAEVLGWGAFTLVLVVVALLWFGVPWLVVLGVGATVLVGLGGVAAAMLLSPDRPSAAPPGDAGAGPDDHPRVP